MRYYMDAVGAHRIEEANSELEYSFVSKLDRKVSGGLYDEKPLGAKASFAPQRTPLAEVDEESSSFDTAKKLKDLGGESDEPSR